MNMANRNESDVRQHETLPGPGPGGSALPPGARPVEQMVDAAIERIAREHGLSRIGGPESSMTTPVDHSLHNHPTRLRWKGLDVSEEFRNYAERVARGEDLPPFEGRVLAEPNPAFPWGPGTPVALRANREGRAGQTALWASAVAVLGLLAWSMALRVETANVDDAALAASEEVLALQAPHAEPVAAEPVAAEPQQEPIPALPPDVVDVPAVASAAPAVAAGEALVAEAPATVAANAAPASSAVLPAAAVASTQAAAVPTASAPPAASVAPPPRSAEVAPAVASKTATSTLPPARAAGESERLAVAAPKVDEFGLIVDSPSSFAAQAPAAKTNASTGSIGDLARAGQASGANVRREPGGESSAKGSLLVENPSF